MPLTEYQKEQVLQSSGLDPIEWDIDETQWIPIKRGSNRIAVSANTQDIVSQAPVVAPTEVSGFESFGRGLAENAIPSAIAIGAGALAAPFTGGLGSIPVGIAAGAGASYLQDLLVPDSIKASLFSRPEDYEQNKLATIGGGIASGFATLNPVKSIGQLPTLLSGAKKLPQVLGPVGRKALTAAEEVALQNAALSTAVGGGIDVTQQALDDTPGIDPAQLALSALGGSWLSEPTRLGRSLGVRGVDDVVGELNRLNAAREANKPKARTPEPPPRDERLTLQETIEQNLGIRTLDKDILKDLVSSEAGVSAEQRARRLDELLTTKERNPEVGKFEMPRRNPVKSEPLPEEIGLGGEVNIAKEIVEPVKARSRDFSLAQRAREQAAAAKLREEEATFQEMEAQRVRQQVERPEYTVAKSQAELDMEARLATLEDDLKRRQVAQAEEQRPTVVSEESSRKLSTRSALQDQPVEQYPPDDREAFKLSMQEEAAKRGIKISIVDEIPPTENGDKPLGEYDPATRSATLARDKFAGDTPTHEVAHGYLDDLLNSTDKRDSDLALRGLEFASGGRKITKDTWNSMSPEERMRLEEAFVSQVGRRGFEVRRAQLQGDTRQRFTNWWQDSTAHWKQKFGLANDDDVTRHFTRRLQEDAPYGTRPEVLDTTRTTSRVFPVGDEDEGVTPDEPDGDVGTRQSLRTALSKDTPHAKEVYRTDKFILGKIGSQIDKVRNMDSPTSSYAADKLEKHADVRSLNMGKYRNTIQETIAKYTTSEMDRVDTYGREIDADGKSGIKLTTREEQLYGEIKSYLDKVADENTIRKIEKDPNYWPNILSSRVAEAWTKNPNSMESKSYKRLWLAHAAKRKPDTPMQEHEQTLRDFIAAVAGNHSEPSLTFGALRKAAGIGLPIPLQDNNLLRRFSRYGQRVARDLAYHDVLETDPVMRYAMRLKDPEGSVMTEPPTLPDGTSAEDLTGKEIDGIKKFIYNDFVEVHQPVLRAASRLATSAILQTGTAVRNVAQIPLLTLPHIGGLKNIGAYFKAIPRLAEGYKRSFEYGARQKNLDELKFGSSDSPNWWADKFNKLADGMRIVSLRNASEQFERSYEFAMGEVVALSQFGHATKGDKGAIEWLKKYGSNTVDDLDKYIGKGANEIPQDVISRIAKKFTDTAAGTYDERGLPVGVMEGSLAPFFALSKWPIERANIVYKEVVRPILESGNVKPLLTYTLGAWFTGAAIEELSELMANKKAATPKLEEAVAVGDKSQIARAVIARMQMAAYGGIVSDIVRAGMDVAHGSNPKGLSFPLVDFIGTTLRRNLQDYAGALQAGEDPVQTSLAFIESVMRDSMQSWRLAAAHTYKEDETKRSEKFRDRRVFEELSGNRTPDSDITRPNRLLKPDVREFKQTDDLGKAMSLLPKILKDEMRKAGGDFAKLKSGVSNLKRNSYQTFPDPESNPVAAGKYLAYLQTTQGDAAATEVLRDYFRQKMVNQAKSEMVPDL